ncbi:MAG: GAF domain-containing protein, partial [Candidatus Wallbacteria bacterium]|nr:GAF domain-containing protein [Candidatus Wallbacteria bacterium]
MIEELLEIISGSKLPVALEKVLERVREIYALGDVCLYYFDGRNYHLWHSTKQEEEKTIQGPLESDDTCYILIYNGAETGRLLVSGRQTASILPRSLIHFLSFLFHQTVKESSTSFHLSRLNTLYEISKNTNSIVDLSTGMATVIDLVNQFIPFDVGLLYRWSEENSQLELERSYGKTADIRMRGTVLAGEGPLGEVAYTKKPRLFFDEPVKSYLAVPIITGSTLRGVLAIGTYQSY